MATGQFDWLNVIDLDAAVASTKAEMYGDWIRDPWGWPELDFHKTDPTLLSDRLNSGRARFERVSVPKTNFGTRPAVVQAPTDRLAFHALVNTVSVPIAGGLAPFVGGWRLDRTEPKSGRFVKNQQEWLGFIASRRHASERTSTLLATDITNFFGSIRLGPMMDVVYRGAGKTRPTEALEQILTIFNELPDRAGIPQRSTASALLANAYLASVDDVLRRYASDVSGSHVLRWMDDIWVFGGHHDELRCLQLDLQDELRSLGLEINLGKTFIREGPEARQLVVDADVERDPPTQNQAASGMPFVSSNDEADLDLQLERLLERPELTDRTIIRYICARLHDLGRSTSIAALIEVAPRAPQGADHFSRLFARSEAWRDLESWWVELARAPAGLRRLPWPIAQLGTMFPSQEAVQPVADYLCEVLDQGKTPPLELMALASHRLPRWRDADARVLLRGIGAESESPLCRRLAAIALHNLGEDRGRVASILSEFEENQCTRAMLAAHMGRPIRESADFDLASKPSS